MNKIRLNIDDKEVLGLPGQTILEVAKKNDIFIPTLCYDERAEIYGSCGICVVEVEGSPKLFKACATEIAPNMVIKTNTDRVKESRKTNLELLLSNHNGDCKAPCSLGCPANTDCQGYVGLIANGFHKAAVKLVKDKIPLPASIGRVCPHPCENACRRGLVEEPIAIKELKRFVGDRDLESDDPYIPEIAKPTGKKVAIVGGGPAGLSASYFLAQKGHDVTIYDAMPKLGGMIRYGIPEYRLPKEILQKEIDLIAEMGVKMVPNTKVGVDISFDSIKAKHDAVLLGIGAWSSVGLNCKGIETPGVMGGIDFLEKIAKSRTVNLGENVAIVGGGNVAMDACRTAVRMGAKKVYNIYRRTINEMPAEPIEIREAQEEGVIFENLTNPINIIAGEDGRVSKVELQVMQLGEPDAKGRRRPVPVEGQTKVLDVDTIIIAIGQQVDSKLFDGIEKTRKNSLVYDPETYMTATKGVFACGDCGNDKVSIAVESIADAKKAAESIDAYLYGKELKYKKPYVHERDDITEEYFEDRERKYRPIIKENSPQERKDHFLEITEGFTEEQARTEAQRCLECGCQKFYECKLIDYANIYDVKPERFEGEKTILPIDDSHPYIIRDMNKCILCGLCVRTCDEVMGSGALGLVHRGFDTQVQPALGQKLEDTNCRSCGQCVSVCPTGALQEKTNLKKNVPLKKETTKTTCSYCSVGCSIELKTYGNLFIKADPDLNGVVNKGLICGRGKWAFDSALDDEKILKPLMKIDGKLQECKYSNALTVVAKKVEMLKSKFGRESVAVSISDRYTNEEAYAIKKLADEMKVKTFCFNNRKSGLKKVLGVDASLNTMDEILATDVVLAIGFKPENNPVLAIKLKKAAKNGVKLLFVSPNEYPISNYGFDADASYVYTNNDISKIKEIAKAL
ncbi:MAG: FAD-dependent oxidoreductase, partial [Intestinibacter sp.]